MAPTEERRDWPYLLVSFTCAAHGGPAGGGSRCQSSMIDPRRINAKWRPLRSNWFARTSSMVPMLYVILPVVVSTMRTTGLPRRTTVTSFGVGPGAIMTSGLPSGSRGPTPVHYSRRVPV